MELCNKAETKVMEEKEFLIFSDNTSNFLYKKRNWKIQKNIRDKIRSVEGYEEYIPLVKSLL